MTENEKLEQLNLKLSMLAAKDEIRTLMSQYQTQVSNGIRQELYDRFWTKREDSCLEVGASGEFKGSWNAAAYYQKDQYPGVFRMHILGEPDIELSRDGVTATGVWQGLGVELDAGDLSGKSEADPESRKLLTSFTEDGRKYKAEWLAQRIRAELIKEDDGWKFHRVHIFELLRCPMDSDFVAWAQRRFETDGARLDELFRSNLPFAPDKPPERMADEPTTSHWQYTWSAMAEDIP